MSRFVAILLLVGSSLAQKPPVKEFRCNPGFEPATIGSKLTCVKSLTLEEAADQFEDITNRIIPKGKILIEKYKDAQTWAEINRANEAAVAVRNEIERLEPRYLALLDEYSALVRKARPLIENSEEKDAEVLDRILANMREARLVMEEAVKQAARYRAAYD